MGGDSDEGQRSNQPTLFKPSTVRPLQQPEAKPPTTKQEIYKAERKRDKAFVSVVWLQC